MKLQNLMVGEKTDSASNRKAGGLSVSARRHRSLRSLLTGLQNRGGDFDLKLGPLCAYVAMNGGDLPVEGPRKCAGVLPDSNCL